jgi:predicted nucleic acid-binding protein
VASIIIDAGPLIALLNRKDANHAWAKQQIVPLKGPLLTCDAVLSEASFMLPANPDLWLQLRYLLKEKLIISDFVSKDHTPHVFDLMSTYRSVPMSFADACLVCMVENNPGSTLFTLDRDFTVYRQQRRRLIPLIAPF